MNVDTMEVGIDTLAHHEGAEAGDVVTFELDVLGRLERIEAFLNRLGPLVDVLEGMAPMLAGMTPTEDGKRPSAFRTAMAAAKLARTSGD